MNDRERRFVTKRRAVLLRASVLEHRAEEAPRALLLRVLQHLLGVPCSAITPWSMKTTRSPTSPANRISCVTTTIVMPSAASSRSTSSTSLISSGSSELVTSSNSITRGSIASARAIATRCCWPPERRSGYSFILSARPTRSNSALPFATAASRGRSSTVRCASVTFSSAVLWGNRLNCWNTIPIRRRTKLSSALLARVMSRPSSTIRPCSGGSSRLMHRNRVLLPLPLGPITQTTSPWRTDMLIPRRTCRSPKLLWTSSSSSIGWAGTRQRPSGSAPAGGRSACRRLVRAGS